MRLELDKLIIVEGKTDKEKLLPLLNEPVQIVCTHGTVGTEQMEELIELTERQEEVFILVDADSAGNKLRRQLKRELPNAKHLYIRKMHKEVARTPVPDLIKVLEHAHFQVNDDPLIKHEGDLLCYETYQPNNCNK
ncbi:MAG TPA: toprim domain-containing protein [Bacillales bacterium]|nr:toprim domain-containing protein [Bacillales bacterium]